MKLYANINSERSSKGQGGNQYLTVEFLKDATSRQIFLTVRAVVKKTEAGNEVVNIRVLEGDLAGRLLYNSTRAVAYDLPCVKCGGMRDVEAMVCSHC